MSGTAAHDKQGARAGLALVASGAVLWGTTGVVVRFVHDRSGLSGVSIGFYRLLVAAAVLASWQAVPAWRLWCRSTAAHRLLLVAGGAGLGVYQALYFASVQNVGVSVSTLVSLGVAPIALSGWAAITTRRLPSRASVTILGCAVLGLGLICLTKPLGADVAPHPGLGLSQAFGSGLGYAVTTQWNRRLTALVGPVTLTAVSSAVGALVLLPVAAVSGVAISGPSGHSNTVVLLLLALGYLGVAATALAYALFFGGLRSTPSEVAAVLTLLEPLTAAGLAATLLGERLTAAGDVGALLLLAAVAALCLRPPVPPALVRGLSGPV